MLECSKLIIIFTHLPNAFIFPMETKFAMTLLKREIIWTKLSYAPFTFACLSRCWFVCFKINFLVFDGFQYLIHLKQNK